MTIGRIWRQFRHWTVGVVVVMGLAPAPLLAQDDHMHPMTQQQQQTPSQKKGANELVKAVRDWTARFQDPSAAESEGYALQFGCVSGSDFGAQGLHFVKGSLVDGKLDVTQPEIILYEPLAHGRLRLTGADYVIIAEPWDRNHDSPPQLMGQLFHLFDSPNRFGLPPFYALHVWAWKDNPNGTFTNWNPNVSCDGFAGRER